MPRLSARRITVLKILLFAALLAPSVAAAVRVFTGNVADPGEFLTHVTGEYTLRLLMLTLLIRPLATLTGWTSLFKFRRMIGLFVFYYAFLHFLVYLLLDLQLDFAALLEDVIERQYITLGFLALIMLLPLAITSNDFLLKKMGARLWLRLHKMVYLIAPLGIIHYWWQIKGEQFAEPLAYLIFTALLLAARHPAIAAKLKKR